MRVLRIVWPLIVIGTALVIMLLLMASSADAHIIKCSKNVTAHTCDHRNEHHAATALTWTNNSNVWGLKRRTIIANHKWLKARMFEKLTAYHDSLKPAGTSASWAWYKTSVTQCVTNHEGGWKSVGPTAYDGSYYAGRFQKDSSFERETAFGRKMQDRYGRSIYWPPWAQVYQAYEVWLYAGWSRWPTYTKYCA